MAILEISAPNSLGSSERAVEKLKDAVPRLVAMGQGKVEDLKERWYGETNAFSLTAMGYRLLGVLVVADNLITLTAEVPALALLKKNQIEAAFRQKIAGILRA